MKNKIFIVTIIFLSPFLAKGQIEFGLKLNGGVSIIKEHNINTTGSRQDEKFSSSGQLGLYFDYHLNDLIVLKSELNLNVIQSHDNYGIGYCTGANGEIIGERSGQRDKHIGYISMPIIIGLKKNKFQFDIGIQNSRKIFEGGEELIEKEINGVVVEELKDDIPDLRIQDFDFGIRGGIIYQISNKVKLNVEYHHGLNDIKDSNQYAWKIRQTTIGILLKFKD